MLVLAGAAVLVPLASVLAFGQTATTPAAPQAQAAAKPDDDPESATRYAGLDDREAWKLARQVVPLDMFGPLMLGPSTSTAARSAGAKTAKRWRTEYVGDRAARLHDDDPKTPSPFVESTMPLRTKDAKGELRAIDLRLKAKGKNYLAPRHAGTDVLVARDLRRVSRLRDLGLTVRPLVSRATAVTARQASTAFYANADRSTDVSLAAAPGGLQAIWLLRSASSPESVRLQLGGAGITLKRAKGGAVAIRRGKSKKAVARIQRAIAWDRNGKGVRVTATVKGKTVTYRVRHRGRELRYPLVVDPIVYDQAYWSWETNTTGWAPWPSPLPSGHDDSFDAGLKLSYSGGGGSSDWVFKARPDASVTRFASLGTVTVDSTPADELCAEFGLREADDGPTDPGDPLGTPVTQCSSTGDSLVAESAPSNGNVAYFGLRPNAASSGSVTLGGASVQVTDSIAPTLGATTVNPAPVNSWVSGAGVTLTSSATDNGVGVKSARVMDEDGSHRTYHDIDCDGVMTDPCPTTTPLTNLPVDLREQPEGTLREYRLRADDLAGNTSADTVLSWRVDRTLPSVTLSGPLVDKRLMAGWHDPTTVTIQARDGDPAATNPADQRAGVAKINVELDGATVEPDSTQSCAHGCPLDRDVVIDPDDAENPLDHGNHVLKVTVTDQAGNVNVRELRFAVDRKAPDLALSGPLWDERGSPLTKESYKLHIIASDGIPEVAPQGGVEHILVKWRETEEDPWQILDEIKHECDTDSCMREMDFTFEPRKFAPSGFIRVMAWDALGWDRYRDFAVSSTGSGFETTALSGLEEYLQFDSVATGAGSRAHVNQTTGNLVWNHLPLVNPGRGLATFANVTYNSQARPSDPGFTAYDEIGAGFSLGISGVTRVNEPLDVSEADDETDPKVTLVDADSTRHVFKKVGAAFVAPAGVNLHLRRYSSAADRKWAMTRPDGVTHFFDVRGFPTWIEDRNQNQLRFEYEFVPVAEGASCGAAELSISTFTEDDCRQRLVAVTDAAGVRDGAPNRSVRLSYTSNDGPVATITDHAGRVLAFTYSGGRLTAMSQADGTPAERTFRFFYGPHGLGAVQDPRGGETRFDYGGGYLSKLGGMTPAVDERSESRVERVTQRDGRHRDYEYEKAPGEADGQWITKASDARSEVTTHLTDHRGRTTKSTDPLGIDTKLKWDGDNNVTKITEAAGTDDAAVTDMAYDENGLLEWIADPNGNRTNLDYRVGKGTFVSTYGETRDDFVADLNRIETPKGVATGALDDFADLFVLDARGNVTGRRDAEGNWARTSFDSFGQVVKETDEMGHVTRYEQYDPNGQPRVMIDPKLGRWEYAYDGVGNLKATADPRSERWGGLRDAGRHFQATFAYDAVDQLVEEYLPKDSDNQQFIKRTYDYDPNGNAQRSVDGTNAATTQVFDEMDRPVAIKSPAVPHAGEESAAPEIVKAEYDGEGLVTRQEAPRGVENPASDTDFSTTFRYDAAGRLLLERRRGLDGNAIKVLETAYAYDDRGNVVGIADPADTASIDGEPDELVADADRRRWTYEYDKADRRIRQLENLTDYSSPVPKRETVFGYDRNDNLLTVRDPRGNTANRVYDQRNLLIRTTDRLGRRTDILRRADGLVDRIKLPKHFASGQLDEYVERFVYDAAGDVVEHHLPRTDDTDDDAAYVWRYRRDAAGDPVQVTDPRGLKYDNTYFDSGVLKTTTRPSAWTVSGDAIVARDWRELGNEGQQTDLPSSEGEGDFGAVGSAGDPDLLPKTGKTAFAYDNELRLTSITEQADEPDPAKRFVTTFERDDVGRLTTLSRPLDKSANRLITDRFTYDRNGNLVTSRRDGASGGQDWTYRNEYDQFDRLVSETAPKGSDGSPDKNTYTLTPNGQPSAITNARGKTEYRCYDGADQLVGVTDPLARFTSMDYDANGNLARVLKPRGSVGLDDAPESCDSQPSQDGDPTDFERVMTYDAEDQLKIDREGQASPTCRCSEFDYDAHGNTTQVTAPGSVEGSTHVRQITKYVFDGRDQSYSTTTAATDENWRRMTITERDPIGNLRRVVNPAAANPATGKPVTEDNAPAQTALDLRDTAQLALLRTAARHATVYEYNADNILTSVHLPMRDEDDKQYRQTFHLDDRGRTERIDSPNEWIQGPRTCSKDTVEPDNVGLEDGPAECKQTTTFEYFDSGWIKRSTGAFGARKEGDDVLPVGGETNDYTYDARGLQTSWTVRNADGDMRKRMEREYWSNGTLSERTAIRTTEADNDHRREYDYRWSATGNLVEVVDRGAEQTPTATADDRRYRLAYDAADQLIATDEDTFEGRPGADTLYKYDRDGNVTHRSVNGSLTENIEHGELKPTDPGEEEYSERGTFTTFTYDAFDQETSARIRRPNAKAPDGDLREQLFETEHFPSGDRKLRTESVIDEGDAAAKRVEESYTYGPDGRPTTKTRDPVGSSAKTQRYDYDDIDLPVAPAIDPFGASDNANGNGNREMDESGRYTYNAREQLVEWKRKNADDDGTVTYEVNGAGDVLKTEDTHNTKSTLNKLAAGRLLESIIQSKTGAERRKVRVTYGYDIASANVEIVNAAAYAQEGEDGFEDEPGEKEPVSEFKYDAFDRTEKQTAFNGPGDKEEQVFTYDAFDRRDTATEKLERPGDDTKTSNYDFGYVGTSTALSRRGPTTRSTGEETSTYDYDSALESLGLSRTPGGGDGDAQPYRSFAKDLNGSVLSLTHEENGNNAHGLANEYRYDPYGNGVDDHQQEPDEPETVERGMPGGMQDNPIRFQGFYADSGVRTYDMKARSYLAPAGRFLTQDRFEASVGDFNLAADPLTQNRYAFAGGNPVSNVEFDGHLTWDDAGIGGIKNTDGTRHSHKARVGKSGNVSPSDAAQAGDVAGNVNRKIIAEQKQRTANVAAKRTRARTADQCKRSLDAPSSFCDRVRTGARVERPRRDAVDVVVDVFKSTADDFARQAGRWKCRAEHMEFDLLPNASDRLGPDPCATPVQQLEDSLGLLGAVSGGVAAAGRSVLKSSLKDAAKSSAPQISRRLWTANEVAGRRVYQRDEFIDPDLVDPRGKTNLERMQGGNAPIGPDGESIQLHHTTQREPGPVAEVTQSLHREHFRVLHWNTGQSPSLIDRPAFERWKKQQYWVTRAKDFER